VVPERSRFETDPDALLSGPELPAGWSVGALDPADPTHADDVRRLAELLRGHERQGRGWSGSGKADVLVQVSEEGLRTRENVVVRDPAGTIRAWGSVHDRSVGRMLLVHVVERDLPDDADGEVAAACSDVLVDWAVGQARAVGAARGLAVQQIDTGAFATDERQHRMLARGGFEQVRTWWQMSRPVAAEEAELVPDPERWSAAGATYRLVEHDDDLRAVHDVLEESFADHFNSTAETFDEWLHRQEETPGHAWDHWWLAEVELDGETVPAGALIGEVTGAGTGSYVSYVGVVAAARGRGVAKGLLRTIIADAARRGRDSVGLEVDADSSTGADHLYSSMGWTTSYVTQSWHRDVPVA
jgi:ribosomal protein S18 acetylase RimI-like enzyme